MKKAHVNRLHAAAAELAAKVRTETLSPTEQVNRVSSIEKWRRKDFEPARQHHSNGMLALLCYARQFGYDADDTHTLWIATAAAGGFDHEVTRTDAVMGAYLEGATDVQVDALAKLPSHDPEKRRLAQNWKRAVKRLIRHDEQVGIASIRRTHGTMNWKAGATNGRHGSKIHVLCAQDFAEIEKRALQTRGSYGHRRLEIFNAAAVEVFERLRNDPTRKTERSPVVKKTSAATLEVVNPQQVFHDGDAPITRTPAERAELKRPRTVQTPESAAQQTVFQYVEQIEALTVQAIEAARSGGLDALALDRLRQDMHARVEQAFADALPVEADDSDESTYSIKKEGINSDSPACVCASLRERGFEAWECAVCGVQKSDNPKTETQQKCGSENILVFTGEYQRDLVYEPDAAVLESLDGERIEDARGAPVRTGRAIYRRDGEEKIVTVTGEGKPYKDGGRSVHVAEISPRIPLDEIEMME